MTSRRLSIAELRSAAQSVEPGGSAWQWISGRDALTGLPDWPSLMKMLSRLQAEERRFALVLIEIDRLRSFNNAFGRDTGDRLLARLAQNLQEAIDDDTVAARIGGARFAVLIPSIEDGQELVRIARDVAAIVTGTTVDGLSAVSLSCAVGAAMSPDDADTPEALLRQCEIAMFTVRAGSRNCAAVYRPSTLTMIAQAVAKGIAHGQFSLTFQPIVALAAPREVFAVESFVRWLHPTRGLLFPTDFQGIIEEPGIGEMIGAFVLDAALEQAQRWSADGFGFGRIAINVSALCVLAPEFPAEIASALEHHGMAAERLMIDVPEAVRLGERDEGWASRLQALRRQGVLVALDGFSGSAADLDELSDIPFDVLKLDRSYTQDQFAADRLAKLLAAAPAREIEVTLEGIEDAAAVPHLIGLGARYAQGYLFRRPMTAPKLEEWFRKLDRGVPEA